MIPLTAQQWTSNGFELDLSPDKFGELRDSDELIENPDALRAQMAEDGYLLLRNYLDRDVVLNYLEATFPQRAPASRNGWQSPFQPR